MFGVPYADQNRGWKISSRAGEYVDESEEVDYSFSKLPVRERRKLFMNDQAPTRPQQYGTLPRTQESLRSWTRTESRSEVNEWAPQPRRSLAPKIQRPSSVYAGQKFVSQVPLHSQGFSQEHNYPQSVSSYHVSEQRIQPSYATPRQSRQPYRPMFSSTTLRPTESHLNYASPGTRIIPSRRLSVSTASRERDTASMGREAWPEAQANAQIGRPLRVRVYNSDRTALSPNYAQSVSSWAPTSPVYPAYPAYGPRPADGNTQIYRVVQSPTKTYPGSLSASSYPSNQIFVPLSPKPRETVSRSSVQQESMKVYQTMPRRSSTAVFQPSSQNKNWIQPARANAVQAPLPRIQNERMVSLAHTPNRQIVNRRPPPPDDEKGVSEF